MDEQIILSLFADPVVARLALNEPFVLSLAMGFGAGALGTMAALAIATLLR
jgi:hypothetical protein